MKSRVKKNVINTCGFYGIWDSQSIPNSNWFKLAVSRELNDQYLQEWPSLVDSSSSGNNYKLFKETFGYSRYFSILPTYYSKFFPSFRTRNHKLLIEIGRWNSVPLSERLCHLCRKDLGDEFHYILSCEHFYKKELIS